MRSLLILAAFFYAGPSFAQDYNVTFYSTRDGLPISIVHSLVFDSHGYLWMGSPAGFSRYDGHSFINYGTREGLENDRTGAIYEDKEHRIWGTSWDKIYRFENDRFHSIPVISATRINYIF